MARIFPKPVVLPRLSSVGRRYRPTLTRSLCPSRHATVPMLNLFFTPTSKHRQLCILCQNELSTRGWYLAYENRCIGNFNIHSHTASNSTILVPSSVSPGPPPTNAKQQRGNRTKKDTHVLSSEPGNHTATSIYPSFYESTVM
jgi:hypothetical protein